jgi:hypothetical protein
MEKFQHSEHFLENAQSTKTGVKNWKSCSAQYQKLVNLHLKYYKNTNLFKDRKSG